MELREEILSSFPRTRLIYTKLQEDLSRLSSKTRATAEFMLKALIPGFACCHNIHIYHCHQRNSRNQIRSCLHPLLFIRWKRITKHREHEDNDKNIKC